MRKLAKQSLLVNPLVMGDTNMGKLFDEVYALKKKVHKRALEIDQSTTNGQETLRYLELAMKQLDHAHSNLFAINE